MALKPQDIYVTLKVALEGGRLRTYAQLAAELFMSPSEVHASVKRAEASLLLHGYSLGGKANLSALREFLVHGLKYAFPPELGGLTRGIPTAHAAEPLRSIVEAGSDPPPVWPCVEGTHRGLSFSPLYKAAPRAALRDNRFYECLALVDALRSGRARERRYAEELLFERLEAPAATLQH